MKAALIINPARASAEVLRKQVYPPLQENHIDYDILPTEIGAERTLSPTTDFVLTIGGDGTFLEGARLAVDHGLPVLGVMVARMGFLCNITLEGLPAALAEIQQGRMNLEFRSVLQGTVVRGERKDAARLAINDIIVNNTATGKICEVKARHGGKRIARYRGDGVIISSSSGSTAYNLAAGGPLVDPRLDLLLLTPICAHSLFSKPLVLAPDEEIHIASYEGRDSLSLTFDGRERTEVSPDDYVLVSSQPRKLIMYRPQQYDFFEVLREKFQHGYYYGGDGA